MGEPWSIHVASAADGTGRQVWVADPGYGSVFHGLASEKQLYWVAGGRLLFPWEKDGYCKLYTAPVEGGAAKPLTSPGSYEVEHVAVSADGAEVVFSSNENDIDRRHIWRASIAGGGEKPVTQGESLEWTPVFAGKDIAFLHSDARRPARAAIQMGGATQAGGTTQA